MAVTLGAGTTNNINRSTANSFFVNGVQLVTGWWYPTTLTAGRCYWGSGSVTKLAVGTTTSQLVLTIDQATTDSVYTIAGAGIVVNTWHFIAIAASMTATPANSVKCWIGTENRAPQEFTVTTTTGPSGAPVGSTSQFLGNVNVGSLSFQGDAEQFEMFLTGNGAVANFAPGVTFGAFTQAETDALFQRMVRPLYDGTLDLSTLHHEAYESVHIRCNEVNVPNPNVIRNNPSLNPPEVYNVTAGLGATLSARRGPRPWATQGIISERPRVLAGALR